MASAERDRIFIRPGNDLDRQGQASTRKTARRAKRRIARYIPGAAERRMAPVGIEAAQGGSGGPRGRHKQEILIGEDFRYRLPQILAHPKRIDIVRRLDASAREQASPRQWVVQMR